jgi:hypothetical protein
MISTSDCKESTAWRKLTNPDISLESKPMQNNRAMKVYQHSMIFCVNDDE